MQAQMLLELSQICSFVFAQWTIKCRWMHNRGKRVAKVFLAGPISNCMSEVLGCINATVEDSGTRRTLVGSGAHICKASDVVSNTNVLLNALFVFEPRRAVVKSTFEATLFSCTNRVQHVVTYPIRLSTEPRRWNANRKCLAPELGHVKCQEKVLGFPSGEDGKQLIPSGFQQFCPRLNDTKREDVLLEHNGKGIGTSSKCEVLLVAADQVRASLEFTPGGAEDGRKNLHIVVDVRGHGLQPPKSSDSEF